MHLSSHSVTIATSSPGASGAGRDGLMAQLDRLATLKKCPAAGRTGADLVLLFRLPASYSSARMVYSALVAEQPRFDQVDPLLWTRPPHCGVSKIVAIVDADGLLGPYRALLPIGGHCLRHGSYLFACSCPGSGVASEGRLAHHRTLGDAGGTRACHC